MINIKEIENIIGAIDDSSKVVEWRIPDFFCLIDSYKPRAFIESPPFLYAGSTWNLILYPKGHVDVNYISVYLSMSESVTGKKTVNYVLGLKRVDGTLEETNIINKRTFSKGKDWGFDEFFKRDDLEEEKSDLVPSGTLTITCRMKNEAATNCSDETSLQMKFVALETLSSDFEDLLVNERKCDITVRVQETEFRAHRSILMARSSVFRAMYEHDTSENETGLLTIPDCDPNSFGDFLKYLYSGKLEETTFETAYHLYSTSEKYNVQELKSFCIDYMKSNLTAENVCDVVMLAEQYDDNELQSAAQTYFNHNFQAVLPTSEWADFIKNHHRLANKLLNAMALAVSVQQKT